MGRDRRQNYKKRLFQFLRQKGIWHQGRFSIGPYKYAALVFFNYQWILIDIDGRSCFGERSSRTVNSMILNTVNKTVTALSYGYKIMRVSWTDLDNDHKLMQLLSSLANDHHTLYRVSDDELYQGFISMMIGELYRCSYESRLLLSQYPSQQFWRQKSRIE